MFRWVAAGLRSQQLVRWALGLAGQGFRGSCCALFVTRKRSPRCTYLGNPWNSSTSDCLFSSSATRSRTDASRASSSDLTRYERAARSRNAERLPSIRSISFNSELGSVTDVLTRILQFYFQLKCVTACDFTLRSHRWANKRRILRNKDGHVAGC